MTPMVASTLIVIASLPMYATMCHRVGYSGLAMASDLGILLHTVVIAWLLNRRKLVPFGGLPWTEVMKALMTAIIATLLGYGVSRRIPVRGEWRSDMLSLVAFGATWLAAISIGLWLTRSKLWSELRRGKRPQLMAEPPAVVERTEGGVQP